MKQWFKGSLLALATLTSMTFSLAAQAEDSAAVMMYHRFGEDDLPSANVRLEQFDEHLSILKEGGYKVLALEEIIKRLKKGESLPEKTVAITMDDGYLSILKEAYPRLKKAGYPFTVFISTDSVDRGYSRYMRWDDVRVLAKDPLVSFGAHTASHFHMADAGAERIREEMTRSLDRFKAEINIRPKLFAYPYGEVSLEAAEIVEEFGMIAAFGQHSGAVHAGDDFYNLPRFALNETYGDGKRFQMVASVKALPVSDVTPADTLVTTQNPPLYGFTVADGIDHLDQLSCFASHEGRLTVERLWDRRFEVRMKKALPTGRTRVNCTMPAEEGRWRWYSRQFYVPDPE